MSNQFSYELDERQIKLMMHDAELDTNDLAWQRFEKSSYSEQKSVFSNYSMPKINVSISRSFIIPIVFVSLIGGLSVILFSFVDFKKSDEILTEKPLIPNANNVKLTTEKVDAPSKKTEVISATKKVDAAVLNTVLVTKPIQTTVAINTLTINTITTVAKPNNTIAPVKSVSITAINTATVLPIKKKKHKKETYEELPIITSQQLNETVVEPEVNLDLQ